MEKKRGARFSRRRAAIVHSIYAASSAARCHAVRRRASPASSELVFSSSALPLAMNRYTYGASGICIIDPALSRPHQRTASFCLIGIAATWLPGCNWNEARFLQSAIDIELLVPEADAFRFRVVSIVLTSHPPTRRVHSPSYPLSPSVQTPDRVGAILVCECHQTNPQSGCTGVQLKIMSGFKIPSALVSIRCSALPT